MTGNQKRGADMNAFMSAAISEAREGIEKGHGGPFGCVIVKDGRIIGRGHNEVVARRDPTCHGEIMAIRDACGNLSSFDLQGCELYTTAEPCPMCFGAILWANIGKIFYGCNISDSEAIGFRDKLFYETDRSMAQELDREECLEIFEEYSKKKNRIGY